MEWFAWTLRPYCLTADISWKSKKPPWPGVSKVLGYNPSIRTSQNWVICQFNKLANHPATVGDSLPFRCNSFMNNIVITYLSVIRHANDIHLITYHCFHTCNLDNYYEACLLMKTVCLLSFQCPEIKSNKNISPNGVFVPLRNNPYH